jgi:RNA polymerase sigma factor (sigma-70 family)
MKGYIRKFVNNDNATADSIFATTIEQIYFNIDSFDSKMAKFVTWAYKIAANNALKYIRDNRAEMGFVRIGNTETYEEEDGIKCIGSITNSHTFTIIDFNEMRCDADEFEVIDREQVTSDVYDASFACLENLPIELKSVLKEKYINSKTLEDIAYEMSIPVSTVKNWIRKGKIMIREELQFNHSELLEKYETIRKEQ